MTQDELAMIKGGYERVDAEHRGVVWLATQQLVAEVYESWAALKRSCSCRPGGGMCPACQYLATRKSLR